MSNESSAAPVLDRNVTLFVAFRTLFNARFYYPVFAILFLDYGLTMEQFGLLNGIWALTIILLEVPSGVLADVIGRRKLVVIAAICMVGEFVLIAFLPTGNPTLVFWIFVLNRILSGAGEAMASGADEALAYDSLPEENREELWSGVLEKTMRWQSGAFIVSSLLGAAMYDPKLVSTILGFVGLDITVVQQQSMRIPLILNLMTAIATLIVALRMHDLRKASDRESVSDLPGLIRQGTRGVLSAGKWILSTPFALSLIIVAIFHDSIIRLFLTIGSSYYRLIELPEWSYGIIGVGFSVIGLFLPKIARHMQLKHTPAFNFGVTAAATLLGLIGVALVIPYYGVIFGAFLMAGFMMVQYFLSNYLNAIVAPEQRATVLSFRGLATNIAYGTMTVFYSLIIFGFEKTYQERHPGWDEGRIEDEALISFLGWQPVYFVLGGVIVVLAVSQLMKGSARGNRFMAICEPVDEAEESPESAAEKAKHISENPPNN